MAVPSVIGVFARVSGVWQRVNGGVPEGFSGPQVHNGSSFVNSVVVSGFASSAWRTTWVNIDGEIGVFDKLLTSLDFAAPGSAKAQYWVNSDGTIDGQAIPGAPASRTEIATWRQFNVGRDYAALFSEVLTGGFAAWDTHPTLNVWTSLTNPNNDFTYSAEELVFQQENRMLFKVREKVSAPVGGNDQAFYDTDLQVDIN